MDAKKAPKKKPSGGNLRPPAVKRSNQAPVTLQGWLWKQGSDGLMRWKKRWFVLSDFCLFYYKGPEEDKILGSILLPSYIISPCTNESRVLRKFAFKAEHQNMRTYYFAADTKESLHQWMNAMSLATILQRDASHSRYEDHPDSSHCSDNLNTSNVNEDEDSGFTSYHSRRYLGSPHPDENSPMNSSYTSESLHPEERYRDRPNSPQERNIDSYLGNAEKYPTSYGGHPHYHRNPGSRQHTYANAPPKPRRLGNPESYGNGSDYQPSEHYNNGEIHRPEDYIESHEDGPPPEYSAGPANKGSHIPAGSREHKYKGKKEDAYAEKEWDPQNVQNYSGNYAVPQEKREYAELRPVSNGNGMNDQRIMHPPPSQGQDTGGYQDEYDPAVLREKGQRLFNAQRPHSANFLEYDSFEGHPSDSMYNEDSSSYTRRRNKENVSRPKSSIEQYNHPEYWNDNMVAQYNQQQGPPHTPHTHTNPHIWNNSLHSTPSPQVELSHSPNTRNERNNQNWDNSRHQGRYPMNDCYADAKYVTSVETLSPRQAMQMRAVSRDPYFMRSASARLPSSTSGQVHPPEGLPAYAQDDTADHDPKHAQQREESMKRLLEWKQRMLQSPLTKKYPQKNVLSDSPDSSQKKSPQDEYHKQVLQELINQENSRRNQQPFKTHKEKINNFDKDYHKKNESTLKQEENKIQAKTKSIERSEVSSNDSPIPRGQPPVQPMPRNLIEGKPIHPKLNQFRSSYSSDDEESGSGSFKGQFISRTQPRQLPKNDLLREERMTKSELQKHDMHLSKLNKLLHQPNNINGNNIRMNISAGDLLGKTHEELILLLIQLRRTQARLQKAIDTCRMELEGEKKLIHIDSKNRETHSRKVQELTLQLEEYTKQLELNKPLVNLVDNMVKLGSLYGGSERVMSSQYHLNQLSPEQYAPPKKMIEFTRRLQEQRLVEENLAEWSQLVPDQRSLQNKLQHLYQLDKSLQEESVMLSNLQQNKEMLERALTGIQAKAIENQENMLEQERLQKQQHLVEKELGKVQMQLINTTKKLEETAAENAKIEHEIMMLRQKIQQTLKKTPGTHSDIISEDTETKQLKMQLEEELAHVQSIMDELSKRRHEISGTVQQLKAGGKLIHEIRSSPTGVSGIYGSVPLPGRKLHRSTYLETDLDTMETRDVLDSVSEEEEPPTYASPQKPARVPLYENSDHIGSKDGELYSRNQILACMPDQREIKEFMDEQEELYYHQDINDADERMKRFYDIHLNDFQRSMSLPRNYGRVSYIPGYPAQPPNDLALNPTISVASSPASATTTKVIPNVPYYYRTPSLSPSERFVSAHERLFGSNPSPTTVTPVENTSSNPLATPVFKSEAARQIVAETAQQFMASLTGSGGDDLQLNMDTPSQGKGSLKRRHKRHYTISSSQPMILEATSPKLVHARSRDDLDMERCLRSSNTPDVVKSTIKKSENFDESTIDRELGLPQKIVIPERYVEQEEEELTAEEKLHRLQKAEAIKKMLSETTTYGDLSESEIANASETLKKKFEQEKKQREQLLSLNQLLAQEVKERSKVVAAHTSPRQLNSPPSQIS